MSISSSTTRTRRPDNNSFIVITLRGWKVHCADNAVRPVIEVYLAIQFEGQAALNHA
jgi:hypothetical protein